MVESPLSAVVRAASVLQPPWQPALCGQQNLDIEVSMTRQTLIPRKGRRGPLPTGQGTPVVTRLHSSQLAQLDDWIARQDDAPSRPEAIRRILAKALGKGR